MAHVIMLANTLFYYVIQSQLRKGVQRYDELSHRTSSGHKFPCYLKAYFRPLKLLLSYSYLKSDHLLLSRQLS